MNVRFHFDVKRFLVVLPGTGTTITYEITFDGYTGAVEDLVVDTTELEAGSGAVVSAEVITLQEGTEPLRGDFSLIYGGHETTALSYDADATEASRTAVHTKRLLGQNVGQNSLQRTRSYGVHAFPIEPSFRHDLRRAHCPPGRWYSKSIYFVRIIGM